MSPAPLTLEPSNPQAACRGRLVDAAGPKFPSCPRSIGRALGLWAAALALPAAIVLGGAGATVAGASSQLGSFSLSGQLSGVIKALQMVPGPYGTSLYGCQVSPAGASVLPQELLNLPGISLPLNGHSTKETHVGLVVDVLKVGKTESLAPVARSSYSTAVFSLNVGTKTYNWKSVSGTETLRSNNGGGSIDAQLVPAGTGTSDPLASGAATKPVHISGSWSSCHSGV